MRPFLVCILLLFISTNSLAQNSEKPTQTIKGTIIDHDTKSPIVGVNLIVIDSTPQLGSVSNEEGKFKITNVPVGRQSLKISFIGYENKVLSNLLVGSGKELILTIDINEKTHKIGTVTVTASSDDKTAPVNGMALVSARSFSVEETKRYAGGIGDPARMAVAYAGVSKSPGYDDNAIIIRGNSPSGLLWQLEGIEVPNPNHFVSGDASSGAATIFSGNLLSKSDFYTGAFPAEFGNALSGAFDINLRAGNNEVREYIFQVGILGIEAAMEGPFKKGGKSSYLVNYRYSTLSLFNKIGIEIIGKNNVTTYQDLAFKLNFPTQSAGTFSIFGVGGISQNKYEFSGDTNTEKINTDMGVIGLSNLLTINEKAYLKSTISLSGSKVKTDAADESPLYSKFYFENNRKWDARFSTKLSVKINANHAIKTGLTYSRLGYQLYERENIPEELPPYDDFELLNSEGSAGSLQAFVSWKYKITEKLSLVNGFHFLYFGLNNYSAIEPRSSLQWQFASNQTISFGFGMHSRIESLGNYFALYADSEGQVFQPNTNLKFTKARHYVLGYNAMLGGGWQFKLEGYYQELYDVPVYNTENSIYSSLIWEDAYILEPLVNKGSGTNYGVDVTLQRFFDNDFYLILNSSLFKSTYKTADGIKRNTPYASDYSYDMFAGKEFTIGKRAQNLIDINIGGSWGGNLRYIPIDMEASQDEDYIVYDESNAYQKRLPDYWKLDFNVSFYLNRKKAMHEFRFDLLNATNRKNVIFQSYNTETGQIENETETGIIPAITYRIEF